VFYTYNNGSAGGVRIVHRANAPGPKRPIEVLGEVPKAVHEVRATRRRD
jgi:hypothetical protein